MQSCELSANELAELKQTYWFDNCEECQSWYDYWTDIPDYVVIDWYAGINFVEEDFFCNLRN